MSADGSRGVSRLALDLPQTLSRNGFGSFRCEGLDESFVLMHAFGAVFGGLKRRKSKVRKARVGAQQAPLTTSYVGLCRCLEILPTSQLGEQPFPWVTLHNNSPTMCILIVTCVSISVLCNPLYRPLLPLF